MIIDNIEAFENSLKEKRKHFMGLYLEGMEETFKYLKNQYPTMRVDDLAGKIFDEIEGLVDKIMETEKNAALKIAELIIQELEKQGVKKQ